MAIRASSLSRRGVGTRYAPGTRGTPPGTTDPCPPPCPACGGLECLCRPRFFAGQLLTEQDLNRLDYYIRGKHRLHNRSLHGWGVVCGLEVTCHDCENVVMVSPGYALSPCGDDIVVCRDDVVDVCELIRACDPKRQRTECDPPRRGDPGCRDSEETWVLAACYTETPTRGATALRSTGCACGGGSGCGCSGAGGCGCGGSGGGGVHAHGNGNGNGKGGCGCGSGGSGGSTRTASASAGATTSRLGTQCEPTVICEGATYRVWRAPVVPGDDVDEESPFHGPLTERVMCCIQPYIAWAQSAGTGLQDKPTPQQMNRVCCQGKERLRGILLERPVHNCELLGRLNNIVCPPVGDPNFGKRNTDAVEELVLVWFEALMACLCSALLPPCPDAQEGNCVPLATVTVRRTQGACRVLRVCNWSVHRKFATTFPALQYWLSVLPFDRFMRQVMEEICCNLPSRIRDDFEPNPDLDGDRSTPGVVGAANGDTLESGLGSATGGSGTGSSRPAAGFRVNDPMPFSSTRSREMSTLLASIALGAATPVEPITLFWGLAGRRVAEEEGEDGAMPTKRRQRLSRVERENLPQYLLASQLIPAALAGAVPHDLESLVPGVRGLATRAGVGGRTTAARTATAPGEVEALRSEVTELRAALEAQQSTIQSLSERLDNR